jgi:hypothetical protein
MKYYQKINLEYDKQQLIDIADKYMHLAQDGFTGHNGRYITYKSVAERVVSDNHIIKSLYYKNLPEDYKHLKIFTNLSNILKRRTSQRG